MVNLDKDKNQKFLLINVGSKQNKSPDFISEDFIPFLSSYKKSNKEWDKSSL
jgi:hypothetical protein